MRLRLITIGLAWLISFMPLQSVADDPVIAVIVSQQSATSMKLTSGDLASVYWRKKLYDNQGKQLRPANLSTEHPLRLRFSQQVLRSSPMSQVGYWNGLYFHGTQPPFTVQSEEAMMRYVADTENAIGYVDACKVDARVKAVLWVTRGKVLSEPPSPRCDESSP